MQNLNCRTNIYIFELPSPYCFNIFYPCSLKSRSLVRKLYEMNVKSLHSFHGQCHNWVILSLKSSLGEQRYWSRSVFFVFLNIATFKLKKSWWNLKQVALNPNDGLCTFTDTHQRAPGSEQVVDQSYITLHSILSLQYTVH